METIFIGQELIKLETVDSTNNFAANMLEKDVLSDGTVIMAYSQTAGKGQMGNKWLSDPGSNLTCSIVLKSIKLPVNEQFRLTMITSLSLIDVLSELGLKPQIKWPNDIFINGRKIAGVLIENTIHGAFLKHSIVGVGINIKQTVFKDMNATSVVLEGGNTTTNEMLATFLQRFEHLYLNTLNSNWQDLKAQYFKHLYGYVKDFRFVENGEEKTGQIMDIDTFGRVEILAENNRKLYDLKTISFVF